MKLSYVSDFYTVFRFYLPSDVLLLQGGDRKTTNSEQLLEGTVQFIGKLEIC